MYQFAAFKDFLQQQIQHNGNRFGNKCRRCNEGLLYYLKDSDATPWSNSIKTQLKQ